MLPPLSCNTRPEPTAVADQSTNHVVAGLLTVYSALYVKVPSALCMCVPVIFILRNGREIRKTAVERIEAAFCENPSLGVVAQSSNRLGNRRLMQERITGKGFMKSCAVRFTSREMS